VTARNLAGQERGKAHREQIRAAMLDHVKRHPLAKPLSGKALHAQFPHLAISSILWHVAAIRAEADAQAGVDTLESF
jgi:hypothetical protein